ncbi:unnamed protein product [Urochloa humidicola]
MQDNWRQRYHGFFYCNSTSFVASIFLMLLLLPLSMSSKNKKVWSMALKTMLMLGFLGLLGAYAAGSSRDWKTSIKVIAIVFSVLAYFGIYVVVSLLRHKGSGNELVKQMTQPV